MVCSTRFVPTNVEDSAGDLCAVYDSIRLRLYYYLS